MGAKLSCPLPAAEIASIRAETGCTEEHIVELWHRFQKLDRHQRGTLGRDDFLSIPDFMTNPLADRITHLFFPPPPPHHHHQHRQHSNQSDINKNHRIDEEDEDAEEEEQDSFVGGGVSAAAADQRVDFRQFVKTLAIFRPLTEKEVRDSDAGADFINSKKEKLRFSFR